jgi:hypothetical protein
MAVKPIPGVSQLLFHHEGVPANFGKYRGSRYAQTARIPPNEWLLGCVDHWKADGIDEQELRMGGKGIQCAAHGQARGGDDPKGINLILGCHANSPRQRFLLYDGCPEPALRRGHFL